MTKEVMQQALEALENHEGNYKLGRAGCERQEAVITAIKEVLAQQPRPEQQQARVDVITVTLMREGINKHRARELADHFVNFTLPPPLPVQEPDRRPLQAAGTHPAPCARHCEAKAFEIEIRGLKSALKQAQPVQEPATCRFCHSKKGCWTWQCYHCGEIDDVQQPAPPQQQAKPVQEQQQVGPVEDMLLRRAVLRSAKIVSDGRFVTKQAALEQPPLPVQEPVAWDKPSASFDDWWDGDRRRDTANPFTTDSFAFWAFEGWQAALAQRPWQGLTEEEIMVIGDKVANEHLVGLVSNFRVRLARAIEAKLKERNK